MEISVVETGCQREDVATQKIDQQKTGCQRFCGRIVSLCTPSSSTTIHFATLVLALLLFCGIAWGLFHEQAEPGGPIFALLLLVLLCYIGGQVVTLVRLPALIGMLVAGFVYRNSPLNHYYNDIPVKWTFILRNSALVVILLRAGLGLDPKILKKLSFVCFRLALFPCLIEAVTSAVASFYIFEFPWPFGFCLGFVLAAVSPAVVVPSMLLLEERGLGCAKGIPTLVIAAASIDDVFAITGFGLSLGIAFSTGSLAWTLVKGPLAVVVGLAYGAVIGVLCWYLPKASSDRKVFYRIILLVFGGLAATFMSIKLDFAATGAIACLSLAFVAALRWREENDENVPICDAVNGLWIILQIFLFGLIGAEVSVDGLQKDVGYGLSVLAIGLFFRIIAAFLCLCKAGFNSKERIFIALAWLPKATVQAAIGSVVLDLAMALENSEDFIIFVNRGKQILTVAVLSIMVTAPIGALAIAILAPVLLKKEELVETKKCDEKAPAHDGILTVAVLSIMVTAPIGALAVAMLAPILLQKQELVETKKFDEKDPAQDNAKVEPKQEEEIVETII